MRHFSIFPYTHILCPTQPHKTLPIIGGNIQIAGTLKATLNLGLSRLLPSVFYAVDLACGIVGADLLTRQGLTVNLTAR